MSARSYFRRSIVPLLSLLLVGGAAFVLWREPFRARQIKRELVEGKFRDPGENQFLGDPVAVRVCEELVTDPQWHERLPPTSAFILVGVLAAAKSEALTPGLQAAVAAWNREPPSLREPSKFFFGRTAIETLLRLDTASTRAALRDLEREFPPFPSPYAITLPHYLRLGKDGEVLALAHSILDTARRIPDPAAPGGARSRLELLDLAVGLDKCLDVKSGVSEALPLAEVMELRLSIFTIRFLEGASDAQMFFLARRAGSDFAAPLLRHLPEIPTINDAQMKCLVSLWRDNCLPPQTLPAAWAQLRQEAGGDVGKIHWLKKQMIMDVLRFNGTPADLPLLEALKGDPFLVRTLEKRHPDKTREKGRQDARAPIPPGWSEVSTDSFGSLAEEIHKRRAAQRAEAEAKEAAK